MNTLFEESDYLNSPIEAFPFDSERETYPVKAHWHYFCEMLYVIRGEGNIICNEKEYSIAPGDVVLFHPQAVHAIYGDKPIYYYVIKFDLNLLKTNGNHFIGLGHIVHNAFGDLKAPILLRDSQFSFLNVREIFETCIREVNTREYGYDLCVQSQLTLLLTGFLRIWRSLGFDTDKAATNPVDSHAMYSIAQYIDQNLGKNLKVEELAAKCNMSYSYFAKRFRALYGRSCKEYIEFVRVSRVKDMLLFTDFDLNYISQETGFSDCSHLIRTFKKLENITPKQYRLQHEKEFRLQNARTGRGL